MNCIDRWLHSVLVVLIVSFLSCVATAQTTCLTDRLADFQTDSGEYNLNTYAAIYRDSNPATPACNAKAATHLKAKLRNTFGPDLSNPLRHDDPFRNVGPFQGWLEGAFATYVFITAYRLNSENLIDADLETLIDAVATQLGSTGHVDANGTFTLSSLDSGNSLFPHCAVDTTGDFGNNCMDDYSVAAGGFAWAAAYKVFRNRPINIDYVSITNGAIDASFSTSQSICIVPNAVAASRSISLDAGDRGPCTGTVLPQLDRDLNTIPNLKDGSAIAISLNHGHETPAYGYGLLTSISTAVAGLQVAGASHGFSEEQQIVAKALLQEAENVVDSSSATFSNSCIKVNFASTHFTITGGESCSDFGYRPGMYPLRKFYTEKLGITSFPGVLPMDFGGADIFPDRCPGAFFGLGRETYYGLFGWDAFSTLLSGDSLSSTINSCIPPRRRAVAHSVNPSVGSSAYDFRLVDPADPTLEVPVSFILSGDLPAGITFSNATGELSGTPVPSPGIFNFLVTAVYSDGGALTQDYALPVCQSTSGTPNLIVNASTNFSFSTGPLSNNPLHLLVYDLVSGSLPSGTLLDENTGTVSGVVTTPGTYSARVRVARRPSGTVEVAACPAGTTTDALYQILVGCGAGCQQNEGYNDGLDNDNVWGWAWNSSFPTSPLQVDIYESVFDTVPDGTPLLGRVTSNLFRQDLRDAGKGDGNHAFVFAIPDSLKDGNIHRIHVTFAGTKTELNWSPRVLTAPARFSGVHSGNDCNRIDGYAVDSWQSNNPVDVNIFDNGQLLATLVASYDATVVPATSGHGAHGFLYYTPDRLKDGAIHQITVAFKLFGTQLATTNRSLSCPAAPPASNPAWEGWFDNVTCDRVDGWAWDANRPNSPIDVAIYYEGGYLATLTANFFGQDLLDAGKGNGVHRYVYYLPDLLKDGGSHHVVAQIVGQNTNLPISSPITNGNVSCAALPPPAPPPPHALANTSAGPSVTASSGPARGSAPGVDVTFSSVSVAGLTSFVPYDPATLPPLPSGYAYPHAAISPAAFDVSTTAGYSGQILVTFTVLGESDPGEFSQLRILHLEGGVWQDRTSSLSTFSAHQVSALVSSFSPFVVARLVQRPVTTSVGIVSSGTTVYGQNVRFTAHVYGLGSSAVPAGNVTFFDGGQAFATQQLDASGQASLNTSLLTAGMHSISVSYSGDFSFPASSGSTTQVVVPATLSIAVASASRTYGEANPSFTGTVAGLLNGDNISAAYSTTATPASNMGSYAITATLSDPNGKLGNYTTTVQNGVLTITVTLLTVTPNSASRFYGDADPALTGTFSGLQNNDNITAAYQSSATATSVVGTYSITSTLSDPGGKLSNYSISQPVGTLIVQPSPLQVTANNKTKMYGDPVPVLEGTITGIRNGDNIQAQYSTTATAQSLVGIYPITPAIFDPGARLGNYTATLQKGNLTVTRSNIALALPTFNPAGGVYPLGQAITISEVTSGTAAIHYTTDGSVPTALSPVYTGPIILNAPFTLTAIAMQPEYLDSGLAIAGYSNQIPISASPASQTVLSCGSASYTVSVPAMNGVSGSLAVSVNGLPAGATASFSPASIGSPGSSTLMVFTSPSTPVATYPLTITVTGATSSGATNVTLVVQDFTLAATPSSQTMAAGGTAVYNVSTSALNGFGGNVGLSVSGLPANSSVTFSPPSIIAAGSSNLVLNATSSTPSGTYMLTVSGSSGCLTHTQPLTVVVNALPPGPGIVSLDPSTGGPVGSSLIIKGVNFGDTQGNSTVMVNGTVAPQITNWRAKSITTRVPPGATSGLVVVTVGGQVSNGVTFTVQ